MRRSKSKYKLLKAILNRKDGFSSREIRKRVEFSDSYVYKILENLAQEGILSKSKSRQKITYVVVDADRLKELIQKEPKPVWYKEFFRQIDKTRKGLAQWLKVNS